MLKEKLRVPGLRVKEETSISTQSEVSEGIPFLRRTTLADAPKDAFNLVYLIFLLNGLGALMPWNMFTTADAYFREVKLHGSVYARDFQSYLGVSSQVPNLLFACINLFAQLRGSLTVRVLVSLSGMFVIFLLTTVLAAVNTEGYEATFFAVTMASVVLINCAVGVYQNSFFGLAADLPMKYGNALLIGNNISGTAVAIVGLITMSSSPDKNTAAIFYFAAALIIVGMCIASAFVLPKCKFYRHYNTIGELNRSNAPHEKGKMHSVSTKRIGCWTNFKTYLRTYWDVVRQASMQIFNVFFVFFVTLAVYPAVLADIRPSKKDFWLPADDVNNKNYFRAVSCFLFFNVFAMLGSMTSNWIRFPGPRLAWIPITMRVLFIPFFLFCNYRPFTRTLPVFIYDEHVYMVMVVLFSFTSGYFGSVAMMYAPRAVPADKARIAGMMGGFFLIVGICAGVNFTFVLSSLAGHKDPNTIEMLNSTVAGYTT